jgi:hypothetical protein
VPLQRVAAFGALFDEDLDESTSVGRAFPWQRSLACRQLDHNVADSPGLAWLQLQFGLQIVAFVEQCDGCDPVLDRRSVGILDRRKVRASVASNVLGNIGRDRPRRIGLLAARREQQYRRERRQQPKMGRRPHWSGVR